MKKYILLCLATAIVSLSGCTAPAKTSSTTTTSSETTRPGPTTTTTTETTRTK